MATIDTRGSNYKHPYYKQIILTFPNVACTTIANKRNWNCDGVTIREKVTSRDANEGHDNDEAYDDMEGEGEKGDYSVLNYCILHASPTCLGV